MSQTIIYFVESRSEEQRNLLCQWVERFYEAGKRVHVIADSSTAAQHLDQLLWSFSQESFVPHRVVAAKTESTPIDPVVITAGEAALSDFDAVVSDGPVSLEFMKRFKEAVHFILLDDQERRQESRMLWQAARDQGLQVQHIRHPSSSRPPSR